MIGFVAWIGLVALLAVGGHLSWAILVLVIPILFWMLMERFR